MKTAICLPPGGSIYRENQYDSFRGEGRFTINIGFGLSLLNYEVHIISNWDLDKPKNVYPNVYIYNRPIYPSYDIAFLFSDVNRLKATKFTKGIYMGYETKHIDEAIDFTKETGIPLTFVCPYKNLIEYENDRAPFNVYYLPLLMPIPSINIGFIPFYYKPKKEALKVYLNFSQWAGSTDSHVFWSQKQQLVIDYLKAKFPEKILKLYIHIENSQVISKCLIKGDETYYFPNDKNYYDDVINLLKEMDICITTGEIPRLSGCVNDIISLGKPLIYIVKDNPITEPILNHLYDCPKSMIYSQEKDVETAKKLERFISNPEISYNCYKQASKDMEFDNWKEFAKQIFN
ncbi:MAG: hypothetical protein PHP08_00125 [Candidatus Dojkabacteria bacterium]|nr:hypothetical protein [Candidatus Dojkabacteria bacterium]